jgi:hypothetical protein
VLLEMASDLEAIYLHHLAAGCAEAEAARLAEERVLASQEVTDRLLEVHASGADRWLRAISGRLRSDLEPFLFVFAVLPMVALAAAVLVRQVAVMPVSGWLAATAALLVVVVALSTRKAVQLFGRRPVELWEMREGLVTILFVGMLAPAVGAIALLLSAYRLMQTLSSGSTPALEALVSFGQHTALFGTSLLLALVAATVWAFLSRRAAALEEAERILLLGE